MDDTQLISSDIAPKKARTAAKFRRETKVFFEAMESGHPYVATLDPDVVASPGGIPIVLDNKLIGGDRLQWRYRLAGCSGLPGGHRRDQQMSCLSRPANKRMRGTIVAH